MEENGTEKKTAESTEPKAPESAESLLFEKTSVNPQFAVGLHLFLEIKHKGQRLRTRANLIGWYRPHFLITTAPITDRRTIILQPGTEIITRYLLEGTVYAFLTRLERKFQDPMPIWILDYPEMVEIKNLRNSPRIQTLLNVKTSEEKQWMLLDLSQNGALISVDTEPKLGEEIQLNFTLPNGDEIKELQVEVIRLHASADDCSVGVRFKEGADQIEKIKQYVESLEQLSKRPQAEFEIDE